MIGLSTSRNTASPAAIHAHLRECDARFTPALSARVDLAGYARKLATSADRFEAWYGERLVGLVAAYLSTAATEKGFISSVSVTRDFGGKGLATALMLDCRQVARGQGLAGLTLDVSAADEVAQAFYRKLGFEVVGDLQNGFLRMEADLAVSVV